MQQPGILPGNFSTWWVFQQIGASLWNEWGGINTQAIESGLKILGIPQNNQGIIYQKLLILTYSMRKTSDGQ